MSRGRGRRNQEGSPYLPGSALGGLCQRLQARFAAPAPGRCPVLVGIPCMDHFWTESVRALTALELPYGSAILLQSGGTTLVAKRNWLAEAFIAKPQFGALLFLDSDMVPPPETVTRLLDHRLPMCGAAYYQRSPPTAAA